MRTYDISFEGVSVSAAQDLVAVLGPTGARVARIKRARVGCTNTSIPTAQMLEIRCRLASATFSVGSGGSTPTPRPLDIGDAAATVTAGANLTTKSTTTGSFTVIEETGVHAYAGYDYTWPADARPTIGPSEGFVFELLSTVSGTVNLSGGVTVEEVGG